MIDKLIIFLYFFFTSVIYSLTLYSVFVSFAILLNNVYNRSIQNNKYNNELGHSVQ